MANNMLPNHNLSPTDNDCLPIACRVHLRVWKQRLEAGELLVIRISISEFFKNVFLQSPSLPLSSWLLTAMWSWTNLQDFVKTLDWRVKVTIGRLTDIAFESSLSFFTFCIVSKRSSIVLLSLASQAIHNIFHRVTINPYANS